MFCYAAAYRVATECFRGGEMCHRSSSRRLVSWTAPCPHPIIRAFFALLSTLGEMDNNPFSAAYSPSLHYTGYRPGRRRRSFWNDVLISFRAASSSCVFQGGPPFCDY
jgi:hypothetical protein